jgi:hypothetical protein
MFEPLEKLLHGTVTDMKTPEVLVDISVVTGSEMPCEPKITA